MADLNEELKVSGGVFGGVEFEGQNNAEGQQAETSFGNESNKMVEYGFWSKFKAFWLQEIDWKREVKVVLTPAQQKVENEINEFLHQDITWEKVHDFLFQEISFGKKK